MSSNSLAVGQELWKKRWRC